MSHKRYVKALTPAVEDPSPAQPLPDQLEAVENDDMDTQPATNLTRNYLQSFTLRSSLRDLLVSKDAMKQSFKELHVEMARAFEEDNEGAFDDWYRGWKELHEVLDQRADLSKEVRHLQARCAARRAKYKNVVELFNLLTRENQKLRLQVADLEEQLSVRKSVLLEGYDRPAVAAQQASFDLWNKLDNVCDALGKAVEYVLLCLHTSSR